MMINIAAKDFISDLNFNKFERKNCISKICGMRLTNILKVLLFGLVAFPSLTKAQTETTVSGNLLYAKLLNGMNAIITPAPGAANFEITLYVKTGSSYENDSVSGIGSVIHNILADKIVKRLHSGNGTLSPQNTTFEEYCNSEHSVFKFTTNYANLDLCMYVLRDSIYNSKITQAEINKAINTGLKELENAKYDKKKVFNDREIKALFKQDHGKLEVTGNPNTLKNITAQAVKKFYTRYYSPNNSIAVVTGTFSSTVIRDAFESVFNPLIKNEFNPENITKIVDLRPVAYTTQIVVEDSSQAPEFQICWQFPGTSANQHESYCGYLLNAMLNDRNNYIYAKAAKLGVRKMSFDYEANNFSGIFRLTFQPSTKHFFETYEFIIHEVGRLDKTLLNETMLNAGKLQFKKEYEQLKQTKKFPEWIARHWEYNDESYFPLLLDSVMKIQEKEVKDFIVNYFNQSAHVVGLRINKADRDSLKVDEFFTDLDENISKYTFKYRQNITDLENGEDLIKRDNLVQWLTINSDINIQVNGFADEHEYNRATDDTIMQFIDSIPTFRQLKTDIVKKGYLRPEMMRAIKIIKYLYEHGIAAERLSGTSMVYKSGNKKEAIDNMKCTLTLNKYHKSPSLFEFHYGKKNE